MHLMIDLETLDNKPSAVVMTAGLVLFEPKGSIITKDEYRLSVNNQLFHKRTVSESTLKWWYGQDEKAKRIFEGLSSDDSKDIGMGVHDFATWIHTWLEFNKVDLKTLKVWGNGANFDVVIVEDIIRQGGREIPWKFWNVRCFRTFDVMTNARKKHERKGVHHSAVDDAVYQAECVIKEAGGVV